MTIALIAWPVLSALVVLAWSHWCRRLKALDEAVGRHPAGRKVAAHHPFTAPLCGHAVWAASLEDVDLEFAVLMHTEICALAQALLPNRKDDV